MKFKIKLTDNAVVLLRRSGYSFQKYSQNDEKAFVRQLGSNGFPRFHIYAREEGFGALTISIHFDAKKETYGKIAHSGEYSEEGVLSQEVERLKSLFDVLE